MMKTSNLPWQNWGWRWTVFLLTFLVLAGCNRTDQGAPVSTGPVEQVYPDQKVQVSLVEPVVEQCCAKVLDVSNCDSATELKTSYAAQFGLRQKIRIADEAVLIASSARKELTESDKTELIKQVENTYQPEYKAALASLEQKEIIVPGDQIHTFSVRWNAQVYNSSLTFDFEGEPSTVQYSYSLSIPEVTEKRELNCLG